MSFIYCKDLEVRNSNNNNKWQRQQQFAMEKNDAELLKLLLL